MKEVELRLKTWVLRFIYPEGNGYALVNARSLHQAESVFLQQTKFKDAQIIGFFEQKFSGNEMQIVCEGSIETVAKSAYDLAVINGFKGSVTEFLESLKGEKGDPFTYDDMTEEQKEDLISHIAEDGFIRQGSLGTINGQSIENKHNVIIPIPESAFIVTITKNGSTYSADKTVAEINAAVNEGRIAVALYDSAYHNCMLCDNLGAVFTLFYGDTQTTIIIDRLNGVQVNEIEIQDKLVSGTTIKTINNTSLLGSGDIALAPKPFVVTITESSGSYTADKTFEETETAFIAGAAIYFEYDGIYTQAYLLGDSAFWGILHYGDILIEIALGEQGVTVETLNLLTEDNTKTINNTSLVGSGNLSLATVAELNTKADLVEIVNFASITGDVTASLQSGKFYIFFGECDSLTLTSLVTPAAGMAMYAGKFTTSSQWTALGLPAYVDEASGNDTIKAGKTYEFNILDRVIVIKEV